MLVKRNGFTHHWASTLLGTSYVHKHEKECDNQGHPARHHLNGYQESDEGHDGQEECREVCVHEECSLAPVEYEGEPSLGVGLICSLMEIAVVRKRFQGQVKLDMILTALGHFCACVKFLQIKLLISL